jgi:hypothetical protein
MPDDYKPAKGCTLLIPSGTVADPDGKHWFVVATNPCDAGFHLLVSISSVMPNRVHDPTCLLEAGEHPFLNRQSYVFYRMPRQLGHGGIIRCASTGLYVPKESCTETVLKKNLRRDNSLSNDAAMGKRIFSANGTR